MIKYIAMLTLVAAAGCVSHAAEPMTPEAVEAAAKDGIVWTSPGLMDNF